MIFCFMAFACMIVFSLFIEQYPYVAWALLTLMAILGGIWAGHDARVNGDGE